MVISVWSVMCKKESAHILMRVHPCIEGRQERAIPSHDRWVSRVLLRRAHFYVGFYVHLYCLNIQEYVYIYYFVIKFFFFSSISKKMSRLKVIRNRFQRTSAEKLKHVKALRGQTPAHLGHEAPGARGCPAVS